MKKIKRTRFIACALAFSLFMSQATYVKATDVKESTKNIVSEDLRLEDDFYNAINKEWLNKAEIESGRASNSSFDEVDKILIEQKKKIMDDLLSNEKNYSQNSDEKKIINLYKNVLNTEIRNKQGIEPVKTILDQINKISSIDDIINISKYNVGNALISFSCSVDLKDATKYALYLNTSSLSLGDSDEYNKPNENTARIKGLLEKYYNNILTLAGNTPEQAKTKVDNVFKLEGILAKSIKGKEENSKNANAIDSEYNVYTLDELNTLAPNLKLKDLMKNVKLDNVKKIIVGDPDALKGLNEIYTQDNLELIKNYIEISNLAGSSNFLGEDFEKINKEFSSAQLGVSGEISKEEQAIGAVDTFLGMAFGKIYVEKYFSDSTKDELKEITKEIIAAYNKRIENLDWMSETTKKKAIEKLNKIEVQIGYPKKWPDYSKLEIRSYEEGGSLVENMINLNKFAEEKQLEKLNKKVDRSQFACTPQTINAFYNSTRNTITVPAGILQKEMYNKYASKEYNLGGIGAIIGHEISHAFDNNGSKFDGDGNLASWWTEEDYKKFEEKTNKVRNFYNNIKMDNGKNLNGDITVGENIADIGGMACVLDIMDQIPNANYKEFFESNANIWREISTKEYQDLIFNTDEHSPNKVRVNTVLSQFDKFYEVYGIQKTDKMYVDPQDRLKIW